jgi:hypothetical protein
MITNANIREDLQADLSEAIEKLIGSEQACVAVRSSAAVKGCKCI